MKKLVIIIALSAVTGIGYAQVIDKPKDVAADDAASRVNSNENSTIDNGLGKVEGAIKGLFKKKKKPADSSYTVKRSEPGLNNSAPATTGASFAAYNNYDFVPGDQIVFYDDFADDQNGEFPAHWNLGSGQAVMNTIGTVKAILLTDGNYAHVSPLIKSPSYLSDPFTIEFDSYSTGGYQPHLYFYSSNASATAASGVLGELAIGDHNGWGGIEYKGETIDLQGNFPADITGERYLNKWHHIAIAYKKNQIKVYVDQYRVLVVPNVGIAPHAIDIEGIGDAKAPIVIANFRIANGGGMNMLGKKFTDAKIITHGINFDVDKATIKPESMGTLNMIAGVLRDNPDVKFEIDGHTDNTGTPQHNLTLSKQRADAVMNRLITMGVDASRLSSKGFGDSKPIGDNMTIEGKANNRRVEFVKQ
ncbi:OmpA family protein [uncultured Mucilaginibacter sp.]|uniref:OmpA family protein n=1 Tax=uncultured Mucilaginibacter sp. TaxID=797541 RepID=UPI0025F503A8|nr:OmpA family protein [uncultured Mucilaginibacter sp.]